MHDRFPLPDWNELAGADDRTLPLLGTALLIARDEYPHLDADHCDAQVQAHVDHLRTQVESVEPWPQKMAAINRHLFEEVGYAGDSEHYYDPRNSYLNEVFERRLGNPISLALVQIEVARRLGIPLDGVSFPGHFLVRLPVDDGVLVMDPFNRGRPLDEDELRQRARPHLNGEAPDDRALFQILNPATHRAILMRVLRNLHGVYAERDDWERAARSADRILRLSADNGDALRDRGLAYMKMGYRQGARTDLARYLQLNPEAQDAGPLRERLVELSSGPMRMN
ncbi:SirB1 family protein [Lysobacter sp. 2RAF19]